MGKKLPKSINLIDTIYAPGDTFTVFYEWSFTVGKYLLIFVQAIVIIVFLIRLTVDKINNDLTHDINNQVEVLLRSGLREKEGKYRQFQILFKDIENLSQNQEKNARKIVSVLDSIPEDIDLENFSFSSNSIGAAFKADSLEDVRRYESFLKQNPGYSNVSLNLEKKGTEETEIEFSVSYIIGQGEEEK